MTYYTIAIGGGGGGLWVNGMWENIVGYVKKGQTLVGCGNRGANKLLNNVSQVKLVPFNIC